MKKYFSILLFVSVAAMIFGCGVKAPYDVVQIKGTVTWEGKPLPQDFTLKFKPLEDKSESSGIIKTGGKFTTVHTPEIDGVPTGKCSVFVLWGGGLYSTPPAEYEPLLKKYGTGTEGLQIEITKKDLNLKINFP
jgi:hypothetical protein